MDKQLNQFSRLYKAALRDYLAQGQELLLERAYELGRSAAGSGIGILNVAKIHQDSLGEIVQTRTAQKSKSPAWAAAEVFLLEALSPFEALQRGFRETNHKLAELNRVLEERNQQLAAMNRNLQREISERKRTEAALRQSEEQFRELSSHALHAQEEERKRISRELHDEVGGALTAVHINLVTLQKLAKPSRTMKQTIGAAQALVESTMENVHRFSRELRPALLDDLGLIPALRSCANAFEERSGIGVVLKHGQEVEELSNEVKIVLYRVAQESLTNVAKHAEATQVYVRLEKKGPSCVMEIRDNGKGFDAARQMAAQSKRRLGLLGAQERVRLARGRFDVQSQPGRGTTIRVEVPLVPSTCSAAVRTVPQAPSVPG